MGPRDGPHRRRRGGRRRGDPRHRRVLPGWSVRPRFPGRHPHRRHRLGSAHRGPARLAARPGRPQGGGARVVPDRGVRADPAPPRLAARAFGWSYRGRDQPALAGLTFDLEPGQVLLVLGPSGSGKSTLGRALAGIVPHGLGGRWEGSLAIGGREVPDTPPAVLGEQVGIVFQDPESQMVMPRVEDEVAFGLENRGWPRERMLGRVPETLAAVGLGGFEDRSTASLSGGERQRLALAD
ncbi:MAG: ABC transporter ATP-binding protein, partial [Chloroflexota bacterium]